MNTAITAPANATNEEILLGIATRAAVALAYETNGLSAEHLIGELDFIDLVLEAEKRGLDEIHPIAYEAATCGDLTSTVANFNG